ncbi:MAG: LysR substrate-binding domain-containing protein, partial [Rhizobacter sp.]
RTREGFVDTVGAALLARVAGEAPGVRLRFVPKPDKDSTPLRDGSVDLETGVVGRLAGPEVRAQALFRDRFVGVVHAGHPLAVGEVTVDRYLGARHVAVARGGADRRGPVDEALDASGLARDVATTVAGFATALSLVRATDLVATVPERHTAGLRSGLTAFVLPWPVPPITVSLLWHPRLDGDPAHRWLRGCVRDVCAGLLDEPAGGVAQAPAMNFSAAIDGTKK